MQYLTHHYLIDLVAGGSLTVICFYYFMPDEFRNVNAPPAHDNAGDIPLDVEGRFGRSNGFGGWEGGVGGSDESEDGDLGASRGGDGK